MAYIYGFFNRNEDILYIGQSTCDNLHQRFYKHGAFHKTSHLPLECYNEIQDIRYFEVSTSLDTELLETILVNGLNPKYNTLKKFGEVSEWFDTSEIINRIVWQNWDKGKFVEGKYRMLEKRPRKQIINPKPRELKEFDFTIEIPNKYLNRDLLVADKNELAHELNILADDGSLYKWNTIHRLAVQSGYTVISKNRNRRKENACYRITIITKAA